MCILSIVQKSKTHFILTHNRDENIYRQYSEKWQETIINTRKISYPIDIESQGTWIFSSGKFIACILNGEFKKHQRNLPYNKSRGTLLLEIPLFNSISSFVKNTQFSDYECFTLCIIDLELNEKKILVWDEKQLYVEDIANKEFTFKLSSTLYSEEQKAEKEKSFKKELLNCHTKKEIADWHFENRMLKNEIYKNIQTVCISQIVVLNSKISVDFSRMLIKC